MPESAVELIRRGVEAFNRRDIDAYLAVMHEEVETQSRLAAFEGAYHGHDGCRRFWRNLFDMIPDLTVGIEEMIDLGDVAVFLERLKGHGAGSDAPLDEQIWAVGQRRDDKVVWFSPRYPTKAEALEVARERQAQAGSALRAE